MEARFFEQVLSSAEHVLGLSIIPAWMVPFEILFAFFYIYNTMKDENHVYSAWVSATKIILNDICLKIFTIWIVSACMIKNHKALLL